MASFEPRFQPGGVCTRGLHQPRSSYSLIWMTMEEVTTNSLNIKIVQEKALSDYIQKIQQQSVYLLIIENAHFCSSSDLRIFADAIRYCSERSLLLLDSPDLSKASSIQANQTCWTCLFEPRADHNHGGSLTIWHHVFALWISWVQHVPYGRAATDRRGIQLFAY